MRLFNTIVGVVIALLVVLFAVSNRMPVVVEIWPFPYQLTIALYALILLAVALGFLAGVIGTWMVGGARRREHRRLRKQMRELEQSLAEHKGKTPHPNPLP